MISMRGHLRDLYACEQVNVRLVVELAMVIERIRPREFDRGEQTH